MSRHFDNWLRAYADYTQYSESPAAFHFWTGVSTIAGALRRQVWIEQRLFQWVPNFYIVIVGPAGVAAKSTCVRIGMDLLREVPGVKFGPQSITWQALVQALADSRVEVPFSGPDGTFLTGEFYPMCCITCPVGELGTFLKPEDQTLVDVLISLWDGQKETWDHLTKTSGESQIVNPWINVIGCVTPAWLRQNFPESLVGGGLTSRVLFVYGDKKRHFVPYPSEMITDVDHAQKRQMLIDDLQKIGELKGEYRLTQGALTWGSAWYQTLWERCPPHLEGDRFQGYRSRKQTHLHKTAMVLAAAQRDELIIEESDLVAADSLVSALEQDMQTVFQSIGVANTNLQNHEILSYIRAYPGITWRDLWRRCMPVMSAKDFTTALQSIVEAGYVRVSGKDRFRQYTYLEKEAQSMTVRQSNPPTQPQDKAG